MDEKQQESFELVRETRAGGRFYRLRFLGEKFRVDFSSSRACFAMIGALFEGAGGYASVERDDTAGNCWNEMLEIQRRESRNNNQEEEDKAWRCSSIDQ